MLQTVDVWERPLIKGTDKGNICGVNNLMIDEHRAQCKESHMSASICTNLS